MSEPTEREWLEGIGERFEREHEEQGRVMSRLILEQDVPSCSREWMATERTVIGLANLPSHRIEAAARAIRKGWEDYQGTGEMVSEQMVRDAIRAFLETENKEEK